MREIGAKALAGDNVWANAPAGAGLCFRNKKHAETDRVLCFHLTLHINKTQFSVKKYILGELHVTIEYHVYCT